MRSEVVINACLMVLAAPSCVVAHGAQKIEQLTLSLWNSDDDSEYQSSMGSDLAVWVFAMPRLTSFSVKCYALSDEFFSTAASPAQSCKIQELSMKLFGDYISEPAVVNLAKCLSKLSHLKRADLTCRNLPTAFFKTISSMAVHCQLDDIKINGELLSKRLGDNQQDSSRSHSESSSQEG